ncbi:MAG TPA: patatin-like phospholipase family protein [Streptosporangiaceae bacterium]|nr:patatin-like phospholipase family protein [Streptosporangiaceae bacterium]
MDKRALVLGGGGVTGAAWELGLVAGLAAQGIDLTAADLIVGTSAGAVTGAQLASGTDLESLYQRQLDPPAGEIAARLGAVLIGRQAWIMITSSGPMHLRMRMGKLALRSRTVSVADRRRSIESRLPSRQWPSVPLLLTAVDADTGEFVVFDAASQASLVDAVAASCAAPGVWPVVTIAAHRYIDGGMRSPANADLAAGYERVVLIAPVGRRGGVIPGADKQAGDLRAAGAKVVVVSPDQAARKAIGYNLVDLRRRATAARAGRLQAAAVAACVRDVWHEPEPGASR